MFFVLKYAFEEDPAVHTQLAWWQFWNFIVWQMKFNWIFAFKWAYSKDFLKFCKTTWLIEGQFRNWSFSVFKVNFWPKINLIILKFINFYQDLWSYSSSPNLWKSCPIFVSHQLSFLTRYHKILWECSFGYKNVMRFNCHTMKFQNCHGTNIHTLDLESELYHMYSIFSPEGERDRKLRH